MIKCINTYTKSCVGRPVRVNRSSIHYYAEVTSLVVVVLATKHHFSTRKKQTLALKSSMGCAWISEMYKFKCSNTLD